MRRTKEEAARTREAIVEAALACFDRHGIGQSTLEQIAREANVTKGAIYWHFKGKREILAAIRERVSLPFLDRADTTLLHACGDAPLDRVQEFLTASLAQLAGDARHRRALRVMQFRCEYVDGLERELDGARRNMRRLAAAFEAAYEQARSMGHLAPGLVPSAAGAETLMFLNGLIRLWRLDAGRQGLRQQAQAAIASHVASRRAK